MKVLLSSGSLLLLAIGSLLLLATNSAYTSDIINENNLTRLSEGEALKTTTNNVEERKSLIQGEELGANTMINENISRKRSARLYNSQSVYDKNQASALESYAAAYAAANSPSSASSSSLSSSSSLAAASGNGVAGVKSSDSSQLIEPSLADVSAYASFGEASPQTVPVGGLGSSSSAGSTLRNHPHHHHQSLGSFSDYIASPQQHSTSYYAGYMSPSSSSTSYSNGAYHHYPSPYSSIKPSAVSSVSNYGRPQQQHSLSYYDRAFIDAAAPLWHQASSGYFPSASSASSGLMSSASSALSHWTGGFGVSEIICAVVAIAIGAVILGAPFFLIYLALMGNFSGSGTLSLTNPASGGTATGGAAATTAPAGRRRKKRSTIPSLILNNDGEQLLAFSNTIVDQLSPFVNFEQVSMTFKKLIDSIEKYSPVRVAKKV